MKTLNSIGLNKGKRVKLRLIKHCLSLFAASLALLSTVDTVRAEDNKPNIVYILADDLGWKDVGFHGSDIKTPNIDKLAANGARLEQFYAQPMCTPTRAALMTGRYPIRYGLQTFVIPSSGTYGLAADQWLLPQALKEAGYKTAIIGKWHLGHADKKYWPRQRGFDHQYGPLIGELDYFTHEQHGVVDWYRDNKLLKEKGYTTALLGDDAVKFIGKTPTPFFIYLAFNAPHTPYQAPQEYLDQVHLNIADPSRRAYAAAITAMDDQVGRVVDAVDKGKFAITHSSFSIATMVARRTLCSPASRTCPRSGYLVITARIGTAKARFTKAVRGFAL